MLATKVLLGSTGGETYWISTLSGVTFLDGTRLALDSGNFSYTSDYIKNTYDPQASTLVSKYSPNGDILWQKEIGISTSATLQPGGINVDTSGNPVVSSYDTTDNSVALLKLDSTNGSTVWDYKLNAAGTEAPRAVAVDSNDDVYIGGVSDSKMLLTKWSGSTQAVLWSRTLSGFSGTDAVHGVTLDNNELPCIFGRSTTQAAIISKFNGAGNLTWQKSDFFSTSNDYFYNGTCDNAGNLFVGGQFYHTGNGYFYGVLSKYSSSGSRLGHVGFSAAGQNYFIDCDASSDGYIYALGSLSSQGQGSNEILICKFDTGLNLVWQRLFGTTVSEQPESIKVSKDGKSIYISGKTGTSSLLMKLPSDGSLTGTYGDFVYTASSIGFGFSLTSAGAPTLSPNPLTLTRVSATYPSSDISLTQNLTTIS